MAAELGYPLMIKAAAGGGGRGMRIARGADELERQFEAARAEPTMAGIKRARKFVLSRTRKNTLVKRT